MSRESRMFCHEAHETCIVERRLFYLFIFSLVAWALRERAERSYINRSSSMLASPSHFLCDFEALLFSLSLLTSFPFCNESSEWERNRRESRICCSDLLPFLRSQIVSKFASEVKRQKWQRMLEFSPWISTSLLPVFSRWLTLSISNFCVWMLRKCRWFSDPQVW